MLEAPRLILRALEREDLDTLYRWWNDADLWRLVGSRPRVSGREDVEAWFEAELGKESPEQGRTWAIALKDGTLLGTLWYGSYDPVDRHTTVGLFLGEASTRGQGYGTEAMRALLDYLFRDLGLNKVRLLVEVGNDPARRCYTKLGFATEGLLRQHRFYGGSFHDFVTMGLLASEHA